MGIPHPENIFAPDISFMAVFVTLLLLVPYMFIYAVYFAFSIWSQMALIILPLMGMLLIIKPQYLTTSFYFMLGPYFLKMLIVIITLLVVSLVGIENIVDLNFITFVAFVIIF